MVRWSRSLNNLVLVVWVGLYKTNLLHLACKKSAVSPQGNKAVFQVNYFAQSHKVWAIICGTFVEQKP